MKRGPSNRIMSETGSLKQCRGSTREVHRYCCGGFRPRRVAGVSIGTCRVPKTNIPLLSHFHCHMRISVPGIPQSILSSASTAPVISRIEAIERIATFVEPGNVAVLTVAGVSVDSGIRAYRGHDCRYMNPNYKCVAFYSSVLDNHQLELLGLSCSMN